MRRFSSSISLAALLLGMTAITAANADTVTIGLQEAGFAGDGAVIGAVKTENSVTNPGLNGAGFVGAFGTFTLNNVTGTTAPPEPVDFSTTANVSSTTGGTLDVYVTVSGLTGAQGYLTGAVVLTSLFQGNAVPLGWTITEETLLDPGNGLYSGAVQASQVCTLSLCSAGVPILTDATLVSPFSVTDLFIIAANGGGADNLNISLTDQPNGNQGIPGPIAGAGLPGLLILGFGGLAWWRRRRQDDVAGDALAV